MKYVKLIEDLLKNYEYNKVRVAFLRNQIQRLTSEGENEYIRSKMLQGGYSGKVTRFVIEKGEEVATLNHVEATADNYKEKIEEEYKRALRDIEQEIKQLSYDIGIIDDCLELIKGINEKYYIIINQNYVHKCPMEIVADSMHMSRSRCYELRKQAVELIVKIVYGERLLLQQVAENK
ncbi:hypothetical protein SH1V18_21110 [Vallitalea longa]|uniref:Uncharacterized protein n=1 Tax=Vallitalea longa TaxID=2936439 RepID=A0A9W5YBI9_9FIRM|nr:hypothetical protein [Vallitalea longa]GKX29631.1 hypothetical protein SH1V18_21110 [Vallitalea longa]